MLDGSTAGKRTFTAGPAGVGASAFQDWLTLPGNAGKQKADFFAAMKGAPGGVTTLAGKVGALSLDDIGAVDKDGGGADFSVAATGGVQRPLPDALGVAASVFTYLSPAQIADVLSGNATLDLAPTLNAILNTQLPVVPLTLRFPAGVYGVAAELLIQTRRINIVLEAGAVIKQTASFGYAALRNGVIHFKPLSAGSSLTGRGTIDGNRTALADAYLALPTGNVQANGLFAIPTEWNGILIDATDDITVDGLTVRNCMVFGLNHAAGQRARISNLTVRDTADMIQSIYSDGTSWTNIRGFNLGNKIDNARAVPWGYASGGNDLTNFSVNGLSIDGYQVLNYDGTSTARNRRIGDPAGGYFMFQRVKGAVLTNIIGSGFDFSQTDARATNVITGIACDNCFDIIFSNIVLRGAYYGFLPSGGANIVFTKFLIDGLYNIAPADGMQGAAGVMAQAGGQIRGYAGLDSSYDHVANAPTRSLIVDGGVVTRSNTGVFVATSFVAVRNVESTGNAGVGVLCWAVGKFFPGGPYQGVREIEFSNIAANYNGASGLQLNDILRLNAANITANNNGQDYATTGSGAGILFTPGFGGIKSQAFFNGWRTLDTQGEAITATASFAPGNSAAGGKYPVVLTDNTAAHVGQYLTLLGAASGGGNVIGKVVDITENVVTLKTPSAAIFDPSTKLVNQSGTVSVGAGKNLMTGSGTSFTTAFTGPGYIFVGGQYLLVGQVLSDTLVQLDTAPAASISAASYSVVRAAVAGIPSQQVGFSAPADPNISNISLGPASAYQSYGNVTANISAAPASIFNDWTNFTPSVGIGGGSGVTVVSGGSYKLDGKTLFIKGFIQINYTGSAPTGLNFTLPAGLVAAGGGGVAGFNASNANLLLDGVVNAGSVVALLPRSSIVTASGQYVQFSGALQVA